MKFNCYPNIGADKLISSHLVKNSLFIDYDETLVIPAGKNLVLNKGAHIIGGWDNMTKKYVF